MPLLRFVEHCCSLQTYFSLLTSKFMICMRFAYETKLKARIKSGSELCVSSHISFRLTLKRILGNIFFLFFSLLYSAFVEVHSAGESCVCMQSTVDSSYYVTYWLKFKRENLEHIFLFRNCISFSLTIAECEILLGKENKYTNNRQINRF